MEFATPLIEGTILSRYKRFFADIELPSGEIVTAHTPNTGSMKTCWEKGWKALISAHDNPKRKLKYTLEMTHNGETWIGLHTGRPNAIVKEAIERGQIAEFKGPFHITPEVKTANARLDLLLEKDGQKCYVEIKNVTLQNCDNREFCEFPDAVTTRGLKHLKELIELKKSGHRAAMFYLISRQDCQFFRAAGHIDPDYATGLVQAKRAGVEILAYQCALSPTEICIARSIPVKI